ncbi:hypothetical protein [Actinophytocola sp.]|jgi:hypothetical protein|uniref:hypothetical protein n=1 Tax=Actinophytocola sp. TaxID=1872138 RepID=UPI002EDAD4DC
MTELSRLPVAEPRRRTRVGWWLTGIAVAAVAVTVAVVALRDEGPTYTVDKELQAALLTAEDYPSGYVVTLLGKEDLERQSGGQDLPGDLQPAGCAELLRTQPQVTGDHPVGAAQAANSGTGTYYVEVVANSSEVERWDASAIDGLLNACRTTTFTQDGATGTVTFARLPAPSDARSFALLTTIEAGGVTIAIGIAVVAVGRHVLVLTGGSSGGFDEAEFTEVVRAAEDKVLTTF